MDLYSEIRELTPDRITTSRLTLRPLEADDLDPIVQGVGNIAVSRMLVPVPHPYTLANAQDFLAEDRAGLLGMLWVICDADGLCGAVSVGKELGYWLSEPVWGRGYMTEAAGAAVDAVFTATTCKHIRSSYFDDNPASGRVLHKLGFQDAGPNTMTSKARGTQVSARRMLLTRADWQARHA